jgi:hypothetical protein
MGVWWRRIPTTERREERNRVFSGRPRIAWRGEGASTGVDLLLALDDGVDDDQMRRRGSESTAQATG